MEIRECVVFDTPFETGCIALETPDDLGNFYALDSQGVKCWFNTVMVIGHPDYREPNWGLE